MIKPRSPSLSIWILGALLAVAMPAAQAQAQAQAQAKPQTPPRATSPAQTPLTAPLPGMGTKAANTGTAPQDLPSTQILSDTLHYDDTRKKSVFTGNVVVTRGLMTLYADKLELNEDAQGNQVGVATANKGKMVTIKQQRPDTFELIEGTGLRGEYDSSKNEIDLIGQAVVTRYVCGKQFDTIRGERVRYNDKLGTYEAVGGPTSSAPGGRVRSIVEPRARSDAAIAECRKTNAAKGR